MYAIETYFIAPTNYRSARIAARVMEKGSGYGMKPRRAVYNWNYALGTDDNHKLAAQTFATSLTWAGYWTSGGGDNGASVWVRSTVGAGGDSFHVRAEDCPAV